MVKRMLIDATHPEETRVVVVNGTRLEELDVETSTKRQLKGNIYLGKIVRVEPSLQAAFVEYGGNRHGFLAFSEIHPDYYQIPVADRQAIIAEQAAQDSGEDGAGGDDVDVVGGDDSEEVEDRRPRPTRNYKIQEVIKRRQIVLVQVVKEERGNKGAALTTYLSLAGRYCVLMPNTAKGGGVSRKIMNAADRKRLKTITNELDIPQGMAVIIRTAGAERSKAEVKRDYDYLLRLWDTVREMTLKSTAPALIHEEANLIRRSIRDLYTRDIDEVLVDGDEGYRVAKDFMRMLTPSHAKRVQPYKDETMPLFYRYQVESQLDAMHSPIVQLKSGGYIVINQTEALVAIDVNSGKSTRERHIEETALKTNLEAADEIARQLRLRDLAGLIVIDFIDMEENRNNHAVERRLKEAMKLDRARIQLGRISVFGLLELSRQRLRPSLMETSFQPCTHCGGTGTVRSVESAAIHVLRAVEEEGIRRRSSEVVVTAPTSVALYILNQKRQALEEIERRYGFVVYVNGDDTLIPPAYRMDRVKAEPAAEEEARPEAPAPVAEAEAEAEADEDNGKKKRKRRKRKRKEDKAAAVEVATEASAEAAPAAEAPEAGAEGEEDEDKPKKSRRRGKRGGRRRRKTEVMPEAGAEVVGEPAAPEGAETATEAEPPPPPAAAEAVEAVAEAPKRRSRRKKADAEAAPAPAPEVAAPAPATEPEPPAAEAEQAPEGEAATSPAPAAEDAETKPKRRTRQKKTEAEAPAKPRTRKAPAKAKAKPAAKAKAAEPAPEAAPEADAAEAKPKRRTRKPAAAKQPKAAKAEAEAAPQPSEAQPKPQPAAPAEATAAPKVETIIVGENEPADIPRRSGWWRRGSGG